MHNQSDLVRRLDLLQKVTRPNQVRESANEVVSPFWSIDPSLGKETCRKP